MTARHRLQHGHVLAKVDPRIYSQEQSKHRHLSTKKAITHSTLIVGEEAAFEDDIF
ncbi:MAG: hypothetical protein MRJ52_03170 [Nitrosomonas sp.]|nr:hypothetical protein [Nitrosomonas sp.]